MVKEGDTWEVAFRHKNDNSGHTIVYTVFVERSDIDYREAKTQGFLLLCKSILDKTYAGRSKDYLVTRIQRLPG